MNRNQNEIEFLHEIEKIENLKKEFIIEEDSKNLYLPVFYRSHEFEEGVFNVSFTDNDNFLRYKDCLKKKKEYQLVITETHWAFSEGELKPFPGEKRIIKCQIIDIRGEKIFKIKIL